ncbi:MAG: AAA family ATPase [Candidatus Bathyarchaeota archaeon]|jgi:chromosome segregation protein|nr:AAA family ATPase [Candidatus Bathyarchaeota archaeon A05DMB-5]MDH7557923.1 AAA family ATPase [Candidatus Bathyarchaeota archaeon]
MLIQEVILENFMSYEYARVPFKHGVNVICGPNGSGKSSLLLAISVALGQSYTERSKKLSDLIRWGKDQARVTLILDNTRRGKNRPVQKFNKDQIFLTRVLRRDGQYWFELENRAVTKQDVERLLDKLGVDPDNMLIIMHQNMVEQFTVLSTQEKLRMVEAAVGLEPYRENVLQAQKKLTRILSQEESVSKLLESAEQTLNYWREQYDRFQEKKQLQTKRRFLEKELAWAEAAKKEETVKDLEEEIKREKDAFNQIEEETRKVKEELQVQQNTFEELKKEWKTLFAERLNLECEKARNESTITLCEQLLKEITMLENPHLQAIMKEPLPIQPKLLRSENLKELLQNSTSQLSKLNTEIKEIQLKIKSLEEETEKVSNQILDSRIKLALLQYRRENAINNLKQIENELKTARIHLNEAIEKAEQIGSRIAVIKDISEILDEIRITEGHLAALADVSEDIERMYESYSKLYLELKEKAQLVAENREKALEEVKTRMQAWRTVIQNLLDHVNLEYQKILAQAQAVGEVRLANGHDMEVAGLEILVGFKGGKPVPLDAYTQSGGERTTATMSFLLALQQHVRSPFRAVDEYDIHMDPKNRELIAKMLISTVKDADAQYIVITPSQITFAEEEANIITVQNIEGKSIIREVA